MSITKPFERDSSPCDPAQYSHVAYGLGIQSNIPLPELAAAELETDVLVRCDSAADLYAHLPAAVLTKKVALQITPESAVIYLKNTGIFQLQAGQKVTVVPAAHATPAQIRHALCGLVMAVLLYQRGCFVLHGSAVTIGDKSIAFLGQSGEGKSSMAAALYAQGYDLLTDDLVALDLAVTPPHIARAGTPIKLYPEMAKMVGITHPGQPVPTPRPKQLFTLKCPSVDTPRNLAAIYVLSSDTPLSIDRLSPQETVGELMQHAGMRSLLPATDTSTFLHSTQLATVCPLFRLQRPRDLQQFPQVLERVIEHVHCLEWHNHKTHNKHDEL